MDTLYLDSNILLNVLLEEEGLAESTYKLLQDIEKGRYSAVTSIMTILEIHRVLQKYGKEEGVIENIIQGISSTCIAIIVPERDDLIAAYEYLRTCRIDPADAIHLSVATASSTIFVTRDKELGGKIANIIKTRRPEDF